MRRDAGERLPDFSPLAVSYCDYAGVAAWLV